jgi:hypothetical protein
VAEKKRPPMLDRFATGKAILADAARIRDHRIDGIRAGPSAVLAALAMWLHCDGRTGQVAMSVTRLAALTGATRDTARKALAALAALELIYPATRKDGTPVAGKWVVDHTLKADAS